MALRAGSFPHDNHGAYALTMYHRWPNSLQGPLQRVEALWASPQIMPDIVGKDFAVLG